MLINALIFFSSRRRHTSLQGDWSSDVCSSDLPYIWAFGLSCASDRFISTSNHTLCWRRKEAKERDDEVDAEERHTILVRSEERRVGKERRHRRVADDRAQTVDQKTRESREKSH